MTKGHYDASFESEFIPQTTYGGPVQQQQQNNSMTSGPGVRPTMTSIDSITAVSSVSGSMYNTISSVPGGTINSGPSGTINSGPGGTGQPNNLGPNNLSHKGSMKRAPPLAHSAKKSVFSLSGSSLSDQNTSNSVKCMGDGPHGPQQYGNVPQGLGNGPQGPGRSPQGRAGPNMVLHGPSGHNVTTTSAAVSGASQQQQQQQSYSGGFGPISIFCSKNTMASSLYHEFPFTTLGICMKFQLVGT